MSDRLWFYFVFESEFSRRRFQDKLSLLEAYKLVFAFHGDQFRVLTSLSSFVSQRQQEILVSFDSVSVNQL